MTEIGTATEHLAAAKRLLLAMQGACERSCANVCDGGADGGCLPCHLWLLAEQALDSVGDARHCVESAAEATLDLL